MTDMNIPQLTQPSRFNSYEVNERMNSLRTALRTGSTRISRLPGQPYPVVLRASVASVFGLRPDDFNTEFFAPATLRRFAAFFAVPQILDLETGALHSPSQDELAWAVQNFINRRKEPWKQFFNTYAPKKEWVKPLDEVNDPLEILDGDTMVENSTAEDNQ